MQIPDISKYDLQDPALALEYLKAESAMLQGEPGLMSGWLRKHSGRSWLCEGWDRWRLGLISITISTGNNHILRYWLKDDSGQTPYKTFFAAASKVESLSRVMTLEEQADYVAAGTKVTRPCRAKCRKGADGIRYDESSEPGGSFAVPCSCVDGRRAIKGRDLIGPKIGGSMPTQELWAVWASSGRTSLSSRPHLNDETICRAATSFEGEDFVTENASVTVAMLTSLFRREQARRMKDVA